MKKIKDFSRVIGIVGRGGWFFPSNDKSEQKTFNVYNQHYQTGLAGMGRFMWRKDDLLKFVEIAKEQGFKVVVIRRGLNR